MDARLQRRVQRYGWDRAATYYEQFWAEQLEPAQSRLLSLAALSPGDRVLDVACGTGLVTFRAAEAVGAGGEVVGTDISEVMVARIVETSAARGLPNVSARRMDAETLDFAVGSFDVVLCALGLMYVAHPDVSLREMRRVLRPGGRCVLAVWGERRHCGWADIFPIVDARVTSEVCPMFFQLGTGGALRYEVERAGFCKVVEERIATRLIYESADDAVGAAFAGGPVALAYSRFNEATRAEAHAEYLASIEKCRVGSGYEIPGEFVVVRGAAGSEERLV
jgi:ubiquinone/menaquinone biosynthesis C-methylase UbiE